MNRPIALTSYVGLGPLRLLGMAFSCAGTMFHLDSGVVRGGQLRLQGLLLEKSQQLQKLYHSGPILITQNHVASYEYPSITRRVLT
jgi:hypothetical protein